MRASRAAVASAVVFAGFVAWALLLPSVTVQGDCPPPPFPTASCPFNAAGFLTDHRVGTRILVLVIGIGIAAATIVAGLLVERSRRVTEDSGAGV